MAIFLTLSGIALAYTPAEIAAESKKANHFFKNVGRANRRSITWSRTRLTQRRSALIPSIATSWCRARRPPTRSECWRFFVALSR